MLEHVCVCLCIHTCIHVMSPLCGFIRLSGLLLHWQPTHYADTHSTHQSQGSAQRSVPMCFSEARVDNSSIPRCPGLRPLTSYHYSPTAQTWPPSFSHQCWSPPERRITSQDDIVYGTHSNTTSSAAKSKWCMIGKNVLWQNSRAL